MSKSTKRTTRLDLDKALEEIGKKLRPEASAPGICVGASNNNTATPSKSGGCTCTCCSHRSYYFRTCGYTCFAAGTSIATLHGKAAIETIKVGDQVYAFDVKSGQRVISEVTRTFTNTKGIGEVVLADGTSIASTEKHPFYLPEKKMYVRAADLKPGDLVLKADKGGTAVAVKHVAFTPDFGTTQVFNFTVKTFHNYFADDVLVHNLSEYYCS